MGRVVSETHLDPAFAAANAAYQALKVLAGDDLTVAVSMLSQRLGVAIGASLGSAVVLPKEAPLGGTGDQGSPKEFLKGKQPGKEIERVACLAYFLVHHRSVDSFKAKELQKLNTEARGPAFSNLRVHLNNATKAGYLTTVGGGKKGITSRGEALVEALPNREAVTKALSDHPTRARRRRRKAGAK